MPEPKQELLRQIPSVSQLLEHPAVAGWLAEHGRTLVTLCLRDALDELRQQILADTAGRCGTAHVGGDYVLQRAGAKLDDRTRPHLRGAINATGIILHTGLGRAVWPQCVVDSMIEDLKGYVTLAIDPQTGLRSDRDGRVEYLLTELTGAKAATVVNNNAAATMLALAGLCGGAGVVVSRGQLIEIGGSFRLPDVMAQSGATMIEVGTTNRTHLRDYEQAIRERSPAAIFRAHPSNYRIEGFTSQPELAELAELAHAHGLILIDDLGAGALVDLERFGLPHEPTVQESLAAGADLVLFSADKLIGASQGGIIVGRKDLIDRLRRHPLARAMRVDKTCLMALERTLMLFRDVDQLQQVHPTYRMLAASVEELDGRAKALAGAIAAAAPTVQACVEAGDAYLGSGSLPTQAMEDRVVCLSAPNLAADKLARALRLDASAVFSQVAKDRVVLHTRTLSDAQVPLVAAAVGRALT